MSLLYLSVVPLRIRMSIPCCSIVFMSSCLRSPERCSGLYVHVINSIVVNLSFCVCVGVLGLFVVVK